MTEPERRAAELRTLLAWLAHQREILQLVEERLQRAQQKADADANPEAVAAAALHLQHYYTAVEDILIRIANQLDGSVPGGEDWHLLLLDQMTLDIPEVRPSLLAHDLREELDVLRRFRHRVRHAYGPDLDWRKMSEPLQAYARVAEALPAFFERCQKEIGAIIRALDTASR